MNTIILVDKPVGWTSFDVVAKIRGVAREVSGNRKIKVGHAGTLDPFATGLLIVLVGKESTAKQDSFMKQDKEYLATLKLGFKSTTGDPEGQISKVEEGNLPDKEVVENVLSKFFGEIEQVPPIYSAIKIDGKRAYQLARQGKEVEMKARRIIIHDIKIESYEQSELVLRVKCSSGTYIRTLAEDIGDALGVGAYLTELRRTKIGEYSIEDASSINDACEKLSLLEKSS